MKHFYYYVGIVNGVAMYSGKNATQVKNKILNFSPGENVERKINTYKLKFGNYELVSTRYIGGQL